MSFFEEDKKQAEQGNSAAQFNLGIAYLQGNGIDKNLKEAESWLIKAAQQEDIEAYSALGSVYMQMENYQKSIEFYELAVDKGSASAEGVLGHIYYLGLYKDFGINKDYKKAFVLLKKAASRILGGAPNQAQSQCFLGIMFINAQGTEQNNEEGIVWLKRSAAHGNSDAEATLGMAYKEGIVVEKNFDEAYSWLLKAANNNHAKAQEEIGNWDYVKQENIIAERHERIKKGLSWEDADKQARK
ncbi:sel1 repeat family protein [Candidatus Thioglobus sp.]|nr:sel1 repeat family protein [Candidatus Thioglobus sp.]MDC1290368.1 sel1 repeat family protein [Candidatus Thioglobus sp.]